MGRFFFHRSNNLLFINSVDQSFCHFHNDVKFTVTYYSLILLFINLICIFLACNKNINLTNKTCPSDQYGMNYAGDNDVGNFVICMCLMLGSRSTKMVI